MAGGNGGTRAGEPWHRKGRWYYDDVATVVGEDDYVTVRDASHALGRWAVPVSFLIQLGDLQPAVLSQRGGPTGVTRSSVEEVEQRWTSASFCRRLRWWGKALVQNL